MAKNEWKVSFSEVTILTGKKKNIRLNVDGRDVLIPVDDVVYAYFQEQFVRDNPTAQQRKKFGTLMNIVRQAYFKGIADGKKSK